MKKLLPILLFLGVFYLANPSDAQAVRCSDQRSRSACEGSCSNPKSDGSTYRCAWRSTDGVCRESGSLCSGGGGGCTITSSTASCNSTQVLQAYGPNYWQNRCTNPGGTNCQKDSNGNNTGYQCNCVAANICNNSIPNGCKFAYNNCNTVNTQACPIQGSNPPANQYCSGTTCAVPQLNSTTCYVNHYHSNDNGDLTVVDNPIAQRVRSATLGARNCGAEQIDVLCSAAGYPNCTSGSQSGCSVSIRYPNDCGTTTSPPPSTPPPAYPTCQDVRAYSSTWTALTATSLQNYRAGDKLHFCVRGVEVGTVAGDFTQAQLTINNVLRPTTTLRRPGTTGEFCDLYTIPSGVTSFSINTALYHTGYGWIK